MGSAFAGVDPGWVTLFNTRLGDGPQRDGTGIEFTPTTGGDSLRWMVQKGEALAIDVRQPGSALGFGPGLRLRRTLPPVESTNDLMGVTLEPGFSLAEEAAAGRAIRFDPIPLPPLLSAPFAGDCVRLIKPAPADDFPGRTSTAARAAMKTAEEKAREACPSGNCTALVEKDLRESVRTLRKQGFEDEADCLQKMLNEDGLTVDLDGDYTSDGSCNFVAGRAPFVRPGISVFISPECFCQTNFTGAEALKLAAFAGVFHDKNPDLSVESIALIMVGIEGRRIDPAGARDRQKALEILAKLLRAAEGTNSIIGCMLEAVVCAEKYRGAGDKAITHKLNELVKKLARVLDETKEVSKADAEKYIEKVKERLLEIIRLIQTLQWNELFIRYGIPPECIDPDLLALVHELEKKLKPPAEKSDVKDASGDGLPDAVVPHESDNAVSVLFGSDGGQLRDAVLVPVDGGPFAVAILGRSGPVVAVSAIAVATRRQGVKLIVLSGESLPQVLPFGPPLPLLGIAADDLDGDGRDDLLVTIDGNADTVPVLEVFRQQMGGLPESSPVSSVALGLASKLIVRHDVDGDGERDLLLPSAAGWLWARNQGRREGRWLGIAPPVDFPAIPGAAGFGVSDFEGDGMQDLFVVSASGLHLVGATGRPTRMWGWPQISQRPVESPGPILIDDFDRDGRRDVLVGLTTRPELLLLLNPPLVADAPAALPALTSLKTLTYALPGRALELFSVDVDRDGYQDVVVVTDAGISVFRRAFQGRIVDCGLQLIAAPRRQGGDTTMILSVPVSVPNPRLIFSRSLGAEWFTVPDSEIAGRMPGEIQLRTQSAEERYFRVLAE